MSELTIHPIAALFPMMPEDELTALVEDIKANGLRQPLMVDPGGQLLDGRNRMKACDLAGIEPHYETYEGDPVALIWSLNDRRRHMNKGQRAMVAAMADPDGHQGKTSTVKSEKLEVSRDYLTKARAVLRYAPDLVEQVRDDRMSLNLAYEQAQTARKASESADALMASLRDRAPDLAELVDNGMPLREAIAALGERERGERTHRGNLFAGIGKAIYLIGILRGEKNREHLVAALRQYPEEFEAQERTSIDALVDVCSELPKEISAFRAALKKRSKRNGA